MNVKVDKKEKNIVELEIEIGADKFEEGMKKSYQKNAKKFNIPGFRKGKAPRNIVERYYGVEVLYEDAINIIFPEVYEEAVKKSDIHPVDRPSLDVKQIGSGQNLILTANVTVKPEVELGEYKNIEIEKVEAKVSDEDVEKEIQKVADKNARMVTVEDRGIEKGDIADIDFEGFIDGVPFEGGTGSGVTLEIGSGQFIPGFEDQLIGGKPGDDIDVNVTFPEDYGKEDVAGKEALFKVIVNDVKLKEMPEIDDEFAKDVSEFDTIKEYKEDIKKKLTETAENKAKYEFENNLIAKVTDNASIEIPEVMVEKQIEVMVRDFDNNLRYQGYNLEQYLQMAQMDINTFKSQFADQAKREVKTQLVLEEIAKKENVQVSDEEYEEELKSISEKYKQSIEDFKKLLRDDDIEYIKSIITTRKTVEILSQSAKII